MTYCSCETPLMDIEHDAGCRRCGLPVNFTPEAPAPENALDLDNGDSRMRRDVRAAFTSPDDAAPEHYGTYTSPRACGREGCSAAFLDRAAYWAHRLDHESEAENG